MFVWTFKWNKKTAVAVVIVIALILIAIVALAASGGSGSSKTSDAEIINVKNEKTRAAYLKQFGWDVETPALNEDTVLIPKEFSAVFEKYNELQLSQGFDLKNYCGLEVETYTYKVTNYPSSDTVLAQIYVYKGNVIAADLHTTAMDGFIIGIKQ